MNNFTTTKKLVEKSVNDYKEKFNERGMVFDEKTELIFRTGIIHGMSIAGVMLTEMDNLIDIVLGKENE